MINTGRCVDSNLLGFQTIDQYGLLTESRNIKGRVLTLDILTWTGRRM
jgi:hypothetical protein